MPENTTRYGGTYPKSDLFNKADLHINGAVALVDITKIIYSRDDLVECVSAPSCLVMFSVLFLLKEITGELYQGEKILNGHTANEMKLLSGNTWSGWTLCFF
ncbi:hypothetical protein ACRS85_20070 [Pluralibacter gergoviae]|uniref:hypothetical protein n=1 Tax=Pluralibacter gergoviae TaxID=61647 RepID=UPI003EE4156C